LPAIQNFKYKVAAVSNKGIVAGANKVREKLLLQQTSSSLESCPVKDTAKDEMRPEIRPDATTSEPKSNPSNLDSKSRMLSISSFASFYEKAGESSLSQKKKHALIKKFDAVVTMFSEVVQLSATIIESPNLAPLGVPVEVELEYLDTKGENIHANI
jgi:hypothetical protein